MAVAANPLQYSILRTAAQMAYSVPIWLTVPRQRFFDPDFHPATRALVAAGPALADECADLLERSELDPVGLADPAQRRLNRDDRWRALLLRVNGRDIEANRSLLPRLAAFVDEWPDFTTAAVSLLEPGKAVMWHPGPMKGVIRVHVGVLIPTDGRCEMEVGGERRRWRRGDVMVFDDTYFHRAVNYTDHRRAVLFLDLVRPLRTARMRRINRSFIEAMGRLQHTERIATRAEQHRKEHRCTE